MKKFIQLITNRAKWFKAFSILGFYDSLSDEEFLKRRYKIIFGKDLNLDDPKTYNEKLQWLKLYNRKPEYTRMVDKYEAKEWIAENFGEQYVIPTLGVWDKFEDIDFDSLPNQFVLKCTHDSGGYVICRDKATLDIAKTKRKLKTSLRHNFYMLSREWPYKYVKPRIIAEQYVEDMNELVEYKMFCFDGKAKIVLVAKGPAHSGGRTNDFCDVNLKRLPFTSGHPNSIGELIAPKEYPELIAFAEKLAQGIPQVRVDTYLSNGKILFGEMTFFHNSGLWKFDPPEWDEKLGEMITLPEKTEE